MIDAQLPYRLAQWLQSLGHDVKHTIDLPAGNRTLDKDINHISANEHRVLITKDRDFLDSFLVTGLPPKLLWVTVGNISNDRLMNLFELLLDEIMSAFEQSDCVELTKVGLVVHQQKRS